MKGIMSIIEVMLTGIILILAFYHFFPQYVIRPKWDRVLLSVKVMDILNTIDSLDKMYEFATSTDEFNKFMGNITDPSIHGALIWWKETKDLEGYTEDMEIPYFTEAYKESMVDVELMSDEYTPDGNTVALWHFNKKGDECTAIDETPNDNDGTLMPTCPLNSPDWTVGKLKTALDFDGINDYVSVPDSGPGSTLDITDEITIEAWIKINNFTQSGYIVAKNFGFTNEMTYAVYLYSNENVRIVLNDTSFQTNYYVPIGIWKHIAVVWDGSEVRLYVDGEQKWSTSFSGTLTPNDHSLFIGCRNNQNIGTLYYFNGIIDEVRISNIARTSFDIRYDVYSFTLGLGYPY